MPVCVSVLVSASASLNAALHESSAKAHHQQQQQQQQRKKQKATCIINK